MKGVLVNNIEVEIDPRSIQFGGSWQAWTADGRPAAWDGSIMSFFLEKLQSIENPVMFDIGASTGSFCLLPLLHPSTKQVYAFEPVPLIFDILWSNIQLNKLQDKVYPHPFALSNFVGTAMMKIPSDAAMGLACIGKPLRFPTQREVEVSVKSIDSLNLGKVDIIKIDTEGCELPILRGGETTIKTHHPMMLIENNPINTQQFGYDYRDVRKLLENWGAHYKEVGVEDIFCWW